MIPVKRNALVALMLFFFQNTLFYFDGDYVLNNVLVGIVVSLHVISSMDIDIVVDIFVSRYINLVGQVLLTEVQALEDPQL